MSEQPPLFTELQRPARASVEVAGVTLRAGSRVMLCPRGGADAMDAALMGRSAVVEGIDESDDGSAHLAVVVEEDPGRPLGEARHIGHRFFFSPEELAPLGDLAKAPPASILVAGIGNVFLGDDGFGVAVAQRLAQRAQPEGVRVVDFGIRGIDLVHALADVRCAIIVDALPGDQAPGTLTVIEPDVGALDVPLDPHRLDPLSVLVTARRLGAEPARTLVVGCQPLTVMSGEDPDVVVELSPPVQAAVPRAVALVESLLGDLASETEVPT